MIRLDLKAKSYHNSLLSNIAILSIELAREINSKAGYKSAMAVRKAMRSKTHHWYKSTRYGVSYDESITSVLGTMEREKGDSVSPGSLANFVGWFNMEKNKLKPITVVAGAMPPNRPIRREDGVRKGYMPLQKGTGMRTISLLTRIDQGIYTPDYIKYFGENRSIFNPKPYHFVAEGRRNSLPEVNEIIERGWLNSVGVALNRTELSPEVFAV